MKTFIVKRHGSNAANQSMTQSMILGTIEAETEHEGKILAEQKWTFYNNQFCELLDLSKRTRKADRDAATQADQDSSY